MQQDYTKQYLERNNLLNIKGRRLASKFYIDFSIFRNTKLTTFEALVRWLKDEKQLSYREISIVLGRDERNIWTIYNRTKKKVGNETK